MTMNNEEDFIDVEFVKVDQEIPLKARVLRSKMFLASTIGAIEFQFQEFLEKENICVGNYIDVKLFRKGYIYQLILMYSKLIDD